MGILEGFLYGLAGGAAAEFLGLWKLRRQAISELPGWLKSPFYWLVAGAMVGGGFGDNRNITGRGVGVCTNNLQP